MLLIIYTKLAMVFCSICSKGIATNFVCNVLGSTHLKIGINAYLLNDAYASNKNAYSVNEAFQVFCNECYTAGHYHRRIIEKYPEILQAYAQAQQKKILAQHNRVIEEMRANIVAKEQQILKLRMQGPQQSFFSEIFKKFQQIYASDQKKMQSLESFKTFAKQIAAKDLQFKKKMQQFSQKMQKEYVSISMMRIQQLFSNYIKSISNKLRLCQEDIKRIKALQEQVVNKCSYEISLFHNDKLMNAGRMKTMANLFENQIKNYERTLVELRKIKSDGILELNGEQLEIAKIQREIYHMSDAQMHEKMEIRRKYQ